MFHHFQGLKGAVGSADLKISKSVLLSLNHHNFSNSKKSYTEQSYIESSLNYLALEIKTKMVVVTMATADHWFVDLKLSKVNFNGLIMQLEQIFWKISSIFWLFLSKSTVEQIYLKVYLRLTDLYAIKHKPWK